MAIYLSDLEHSHVPIQVREILSFTRAVTTTLTQRVRAMPNVSGCVLLSTCNRTELYISSRTPVDPGRLLCEAAEVDYAPFAEAFHSCSNREAVRHLLEVAAGVRSRIWGEDQILAQVKDAIAIARSVNAANATLETLFRTAISAGKQVRSQARMTTLPVSAASKAVDLLQEHTPLTGKRAMVIGNGEMGRLAAKLLYEAGCQVTVTQRTYRHGETIVPAGCSVIPYEQRYQGMDRVDLLLSATSSPHYTVTYPELARLDHVPAWIVDLAIPRDIQPEIARLPGTHLFNVDDLKDFNPQRSTPADVTEILDRHMSQFFRWMNYRDCLPAMEELKRAVIQRVVNCKEMEENLDPDELVELAVRRTVDLLAGGLSEQWTVHMLEETSQKIRSHTRGPQKQAYEADYDSGEIDDSPFSALY